MLHDVATMLFNFQADIAKNFSSLLSVMEHLSSRVDALTSRVDALTSRVDSMESKVSDFKSALELIPRQVHTFLHDLNRRKVEVLNQSMRSINICDNEITVHYVEWKENVFGLTVAHTSCYWMHKPPYELLPCLNLDVSLINGCPPAHALRHRVGFHFSLVE